MDSTAAGVARKPEQPDASDARESPLYGRRTGQWLLEPLRFKGDYEDLHFRLAMLVVRLRALNLHAWPGNIRELQNRVQRAVIVAEGKRVIAGDLELTDALNALPPQTLKQARESRGTGARAGGAAASWGQDHVRRPGTRHQPADATSIFRLVFSVYHYTLQT